MVCCRGAKKGLGSAAFGTALFAVLTCAAIAFRNPVAFTILSSVGMIGMSFVWPALHAWIGTEPNLRRRGRRMARFNMSWALGFTVGPLVAGPLYTIDYRLPFVFVFVVCVLTFIILLCAPDERAYFGVASAAVVEERAGHDRASEVHLYAAWVVSMVGSAMAVVTRSVLSKRIADLVAAGQLRLFFENTPYAFMTADAATKYMWVAFLIAGANAFTFMLMGRTQRWHHRPWVLVAMQVAAAGGFWVLGTTTSLAVMLLACLAVGAVWGGGFFAAVYYSVADPARKHSRAAINEGAVGLGGFVGSLGFGYLAGQYGVSMPFRYTPLFVVVPLILEYALLRYSAARLAKS